MTDDRRINVPRRTPAHGEPVPSGGRPAEPTPSGGRPAEPTPPSQPGTAKGSAGDAELLAISPFDDDLDAELAAAPSRRSPPAPTLYLAAGIILVAGFLGGVQAQKWSSDGSRPTTAGAARGPEGGRGGGAEGGPARGGYGGAPGSGTQPGGGAGPGPGGSRADGETTTGTVTKIAGRTLYLRTSSGQTVKVQTSGTTKVRITKDGRLKDLGSGATVTVRGTKGKNGTVTATAVNQGSGR